MSRQQKANARRPLGRPRRSVETLRRNRVVTMVTDAELKRLTKLADESACSISTLVHEILAKQLPKLARRVSPPG